jgi:hypothetical protein
MNGALAMPWALIGCHQSRLSFACRLRTLRCAAMDCCVVIESKLVPDLLQLRSSYFHAEPAADVCLACGTNRLVATHGPVLCTRICALQLRHDWLKTLQLLVDSR